MNCDREIISVLDALTHSGKRPNFIFFGDSALHVVALNSFLLKMQSQGRRMNGVVCNCISDDHLNQFNKNDIRAIPEDDFVYFDKGFSYPLQDSFRSSRVLDLIQIACRHAFSPKTHLDDSEKFYILVPANGARISTGVLKYLTSLNRPLVQVTLEEGLGSYLTEDRDLMHNRIAAQKKPERSRIARMKRIPSKSYKDIRNAILSNATSHENMMMLQEGRSGELRPNPETCEWIKKGLGLSNSASFTNRRYTGRAVILLNCMFWLYDNVSMETDILKRVLAVLNELQIESIVRPHPRCDDISIYDSLGVDVDISNEAFEATLMNSGETPLLTLGFCSSSQVFTNILWDIPSFSLIGFIENYSERVEHSKIDFQERITYLQRAEAVFADYIEPVNSPDSLRSRLMEKGIGTTQNSA